MAREIHDTLAQGLTGIITQLEAAQQTGIEAERDRRIGNATRLARDSLAEARRSVQALRPQALEDSKLPDALAAEAARWTATSGVAAEVAATGDPRPLHPEVEVTLLRVAQEALANVAKHAGAVARLGHTVLHGGRGDPRRPGRRRRLRRGAEPGRGREPRRRHEPGQRRFRADRHAPAGQPWAGQLEIGSEPGQAPRCRPACPPSRWTRRPTQP